ncbi:MAG: phosphatidylglycerophosphatase A [Candidatus Edwardsbacteria bacterium]|nr:phosphatidylglycerophosphatase A [Candidatus Edwardsbacteria bacterium]
MIKTKDKIALILASGFGSGYSPVAPGTAGSLLALVIWWLVPPFLWVRASLLVLTLLLGVWSATRAERKWGHDNGRIVIDEVAGMWISLLFLPKSILIYLIAFLLFRTMDIIKPLGARQIQKLSGGWGVVADDVLAGIYANLLGQIVVILFWPAYYVPLLTIKSMLFWLHGS